MQRVEAEEGYAQQRQAGCGGDRGGSCPSARRLLDLVVGRLTADFESAGLHFEHCYDESMTVVVRRGHPLCARRGLKLEDLAEMSWIVPTAESAYRHRLDAAFRQGGVEPPADIVESVSILTNSTLLQASDMLGVMPLNVARYYRKLGLLDLLSVVTHEVGHVLGLAHDCATADSSPADENGVPVPSCDVSDPAVTTATMFYRLDAGDLSKRDLAPNDIAGACALVEGFACVTETTGEFSAGCNAGGGAGPLGMLALLAIRQRRRGCGPCADARRRTC